MELREFLVVRRAFALARKDVEGSRRISFAELAILCCLANGGGELSASELASRQGALRPTMTHRTKHLQTLGLIERRKGADDRRSISCVITDAGRDTIDSMCDAICARLKGGNSLAHITSARLLQYVDAMGVVACSTADLVLLCLLVFGSPQTVARLVTSLGVMQPTVSMAIMSLERSGLICRVREERRLAGIALSQAGLKAAHALSTRVGEIVVRRGRRSRARATAS